MEERAKEMPRRPEYSTGGLNYSTRQYKIPFLTRPPDFPYPWHQLASIVDLNISRKHPLTQSRHEALAYTSLFPA
jgi:hypothetical protein